MGCTTEPLGIPHAATKLCVNLHGGSKGQSLPHSSNAATLSSSAEAASPLPVLQSEAGVNYACSRSNAAADSMASVCTNVVVEAPANLWNLTAKMVDFGEAFIGDRLGAFRYANVPGSLKGSSKEAHVLRKGRRSVSKSGRLKRAPWLLLAALTEPHVPHRCGKSFKQRAPRGARPCGKFPSVYSSTPLRTPRARRA
jgi:hypothetical protein